MNEAKAVFPNEITENEIQWRAILAQQNISQNFHLLRPLNPLSSAQHVSCDICENPATLSCISCHSCWCSHEHFLLDDEPIHSHICSKLTELWFHCYEQQRGGSIESLLANGQTGRIERDLLLEIRTICAQRASGYLADRNYIMAVAPSLRAVALTERIFGKRNAELVFAEVVLAKCHLGLRKYEHVSRELGYLNVEIGALIDEELKRLGRYDAVMHMQHAESTTQQFEDALISFPFYKIPISAVRQMSSHICELQAQYFLISGVFNQALGVEDEAFEHLAQAAYFSTLAHGPTGLKTTLSYLEIAKTFLIAQQPVVMNENPEVRFEAQSDAVKRAFYIVDFCVEVWATVIRRQMNKNEKLDYNGAEIGDARLLLQDAKAIASIYVGTASYYYCVASVTLMLFFLMYDEEYEAVIEARLARAALEQYFRWNTAVATSEHQRMRDYLSDVRDVMSVLETPEVLKRIAVIEREARTKI